MELYLDSYGTLLRRKDEAFELVMRDGSRKILAPESIRHIHIGAGIRFTADAILLAIRHQIDVVFVFRDGGMAASLQTLEPGKMAQIRKGQVLATYTPLGVEISKGLIITKLERNIHVLQKINRVETEETATLIGLIAEKIHQIQAPTISKVRDKIMGLEGTAARMYFLALAALLPKAYRFEGRSRKPAVDPFNSMLNYLYGCLYNLVNSAVRLAGLDPAIGILHTDIYRKPTLVFDLVELFRPWIDAEVMRLLREEVIHPSCFMPYKGGIWMAQSGKKILVKSFHRMIEEVVVIEGKRRTRRRHLHAEIRSIAEKLADEEHIEISRLALAQFFNHTISPDENF